MKKLMTRVICIIFVLLMLIETGYCGESRNDAEFELDPAGATGYALIDLNLRAGPTSKSAKLGVIPAGGMFVLTGAEANTEGYLGVEYEGTTGYAFAAYIMINLPDVAPDIIYDAVNAYDSQFKSNQIEMPGLTHEALYTGKTWNARLNQDQYNMPVCYNMAKKLVSVQRELKQSGKSLVIYEAYRPRDVQKLVNEKLGNLMDTNASVRKLINTWGKSWFIAKSVSNHQKGYAVDITMATVTKYETHEIKGVPLDIPIEYSYDLMPTDIHELSPKAASLAYGADSKSKTAWQTVPEANTMTDAARMLRDACVKGGLFPLASEWWHFNDLDARAASGARGSGEFEITGNLSR